MTVSFVQSCDAVRVNCDEEHPDNYHSSDKGCKLKKNRSVFWRGRAFSRVRGNTDLLCHVGKILVLCFKLPKWLQSLCCESANVLEVCYLSAIEAKVSYWNWKLTLLYL